MLVLEKGVVPVDFAAELPVHELPAYDVPVFNMWDIDGTLIATPKVLERMEAAGAGLGLQPGELAAANRLIQAAKKTMDPRKYVQEKLATLHADDAAFAFWEEQFRTMAEPGILYDDAKDLLAIQAAQGIPNMYMTYGETNNQINKVVAMGQQAFVYAMPHSDKGPVIASDIRSPEGRYDSIGFSAEGLPVAIYRATIGRLTDDKRRSLRHSPADTQLYWLRRPEEPAVPSQIDGELPATVHQIATLSEIHLSPTITPANEIARRLGTKAMPQAVAFVPTQLFDCFSMGRETREK
jgi:hypothetical protein